MKTGRLILLFFLVLFVPIGQTSPVSIQNLRMWQSEDKHQLVLDISGPLEYRLFPLKNPDRIVVDMDRAELRGKLPAIDKGDGLLSDIRVGKRDNGIRLVLDLKKTAHPRTYLLKPAGHYGHRLVLDLYDKSAVESPAPAPRASSPAQEQGEIVIAVDAGHGGEDPGAIGRRYRTYEKDVVLAIARELARMIDKEPGMRAYLIRRGDYYVGLQQRYKKARQQRASLFVSIHADAVPGRQARGSSVYALTERGATSRVAKFLADGDNASDQIGGVSLEDKDPLLKQVLVDLSQTANIPLSLELGADILRELRKVGPVHSSHVAQAGFAVLKAPDIPSVLVETAFISNPTEERKLRSRSFQKKMARGIFQGIKRYVSRKPNRFGAPVVQASNSSGSSIDGRKHVIRRGDTLSGIAEQYQVSVDALKFANNLTSSKVVIGKTLVIP